MFDYGLGVKDLADDVDPKFRAAVDVAEKAYAGAAPALRELEDVLEDYEQ